ncbi:Spore germination protein GerE [compost metagenome]
MLTVEYGAPAAQSDLPAAGQLRAHSPLSERQQQVAELLCRNYSVKRIAAALFVSENTVKKHIQNMKKALKIEASGADFIYQLQQLMQSGGRRNAEDYLIRVK